MTYRRQQHGGHSGPHVGMSAPSVADSIADSGRGTASISIATSAMTLRERIAHIERQLSVSGSRWFLLIVIRVA